MTEVADDKERPFEGMAIDDAAPLEALEGRSACSRCFKSRKYFCYTCCILVSELEGRIPRVSLPVQIDIVKHEREINGKSTAFHGAVLAPNDCRIYTYPDAPDYSQQRNVYLVYPAAGAEAVDEVFRRRRDGDGDGDDDAEARGLPIERAVFIDSTWNQSRGIYKDERFRRLPCLIIRRRPSQFWRHQKGSPRWYLATVEAIHQFLVEVHSNMWGVSVDYRGPHCDSYDRIRSSDRPVEPYNGQYDNILFFFSFMYDKIHSLYVHEQLRAYKRPFWTDS